MRDVAKTDFPQKLDFSWSHNPFFMILGGIDTGFHDFIALETGLKFSDFWATLESSQILRPGLMGRKLVPPMPLKQQFHLDAFMLLANASIVSVLLKYVYLFNNMHVCIHVINHSYLGSTDLAFEAEMPIKTVFMLLANVYASIVSLRFIY